MKIDYPQIAPADVQPGDTILSEWRNGEAISYFEFTLEDPVNLNYDGEATYYLIDRPRPVFPDEYGTLIIAKKVRGIEFPEGVVLARQRGSSHPYTSSYSQIMWKSIDQKIGGADNHSERQIEDWVLAKVVPA